MGYPVNNSDTYKNQIRAIAADSSYTGEEYITSTSGDDSAAIQSSLYGAVAGGYSVKLSGEDFQVDTGLSVPTGVSLILSPSTMIWSTKDINLITQEPESHIIGNGATLRNTKKFVRIIASDISFTTPSTIETAAESFDNFVAGDTFTVKTDSGTNDGSYTIATKSALLITVTETSISTENAATAGEVEVSSAKGLLYYDGSGRIFPFYSPTSAKDLTLIGQSLLLGGYGVYQYTTGNSSAIQGCMLSNIGVYRCISAIRQEREGSGTISYINANQFDHFSIDECLRGVHQTSTTAGSGSTGGNLFSDYQFQSRSATESAIEFAGPGNVADGVVYDFGSAAGTYAFIAPDDDTNHSNTFSFPSSLKSWFNVGLRDNIARVRGLTKDTGWRPLYRNTTRQTIADSSGTFDTFTLPAGLMLDDSMLRITYSITTDSGSSGPITGLLSWGSVSTINDRSVVAGDTFTGLVIIANSGATNTQILTTRLALTNATIVTDDLTAAENTANAVVINIKASNVVAGETCYLDWWLVEMLL